jgi:hypothetical protein
MPIKGKYRQLTYGCVIEILKLLTSHVGGRYVAERAPQVPPCRRGEGAQYEYDNTLPGSPALWAGSFTILERCGKSCRIEALTVEVCLQGHINRKRAYDNRKNLRSRTDQFPSMWSLGNEKLELRLFNTPLFRVTA